jgi:hypothetical protein
MRIRAITAFALALGLGSAAHAANLVSNGDFNLTTGLGNLSGFSGSEIDPAFGTANGVNNWVSGSGAGDNVTYNIWFKGDGSEKGGATGTDAKSRWGEVGQRPNASYTGACDLVGCGGAFMVLDGDPVAAGPFAQSIGGLVIGQTYALTFDWAAGELQDRTGFSTEQLHVSLGSDTQSTSIYNNTANPLSNPGSFSGWQQVTFNFKATSTTELLSFLSDGAPSNNLPPVAFLDGVSLTMVPEPATWAMMLVGFGGLGAALRRRRALATA